MGEQQSRLRQTQVWCQNTCQNCMSGATDIDNAVAAQTELNRRNGTTNGVGTIIPREELQKLLKQQTLLPGNAKQARVTGNQQLQGGPAEGGGNLQDSSMDLYAAKGTASRISAKRPAEQSSNQQRLQSFSSPKNAASIGQQQNTNLATLGRKDSQEESLKPSAKKNKIQVGLLQSNKASDAAQPTSAGKAQSSQNNKMQVSYKAPGSGSQNTRLSKHQKGGDATKRLQQSSQLLEESNTAQQHARQQQYLNQQPLDLVQQESYGPSGQGEAYDCDHAQAKNSTISSPPQRPGNALGTGQGSASQLQNVMQVHHSQLREAQRVQREQQISKKQLHLRVLSSAFLQKGQVITLNEHGLASQEPLRKAYDGVTYFGCKRTLPKKLTNGQGEMEADSGAPAMVHESASEEDANSSAALDQAINNMKEVVNDFIIPACKKEDKEKHAGRQFQIRFDRHTETYFIKDLQVGYGVFTETVGPVPLKDNLLINMGESYIVTNLGAPDPEIVQEYASNSLGGGEHQGFEPPPKLKLRVFSVSKSDQPDLHCCQFEEQEVVIGRSPNCDIRVDDELLSKMQASISFDLNSREWVLQDGYQGKRSTNGTWLYLNEEIPILSGMLFKSNQTFFQATVE